MEKARGAPQRRPALGRRPWFALRRRARSLRRVFLATVPGIVTARRSNQVWLQLDAPGWSSPPVLLARGRWQRLAGLRPEARGGGLLIRTRSVHGFGMREALGMVGLDRQGRVTATRVLAPGRRVVVPGAHWVLELPAGHPLPAEGVRLVARPIVASWPAASSCARAR